MSSDNSNNTTANNPQNEMHRQRRGSVTQQAIAGLFRSNSTSTGAAFPIGTADAQRRRLSVSTGLGLTGTSPTGSNAFNSLRRGSLSTNSNDSIDENAVDEEEMPANARTAPTTPFTRRMSFGAQAMRNLRTGGGSPGSNDQGFNWSEQLRSRAESSVQGQRPSFSFGSGLSSSPPRNSGINHDRTKSVPDMPAPPAQAAAMKPKAPERPKPDAFQERILKGDFYMD
ncbi:hypothetical protein C8034_v007689 [Colletotrichum sidae]|uniref:Uncharacterized protein n=4 Tax=Colletotrichum orbiculare species complex TaxID=2707354 RepID=N4W5G4_COLOR|nr:hypothetical protein C8035_v000467 [Colletotrichum spinosum]TDZ25967.1 hypothetical protein Cob_v001197 [Colletotrichum orbiculare MAFF 240422]TDZ58331.1 hypothetical protein CTRI78_v005556 [Colletotrichum trifolii]TEA11348.1 hypothetical protein C8034_v007689 [Colletotrichum sidae]